MPTYVYKCPECQTKLELTTLGYVPKKHKTCRGCGAQMNRIPQLFNVNWGGNKPSGGDVTPLVSQMIADAPRQRDKMQARKEDGND